MLKKLSIGLGVGLLAVPALLGIPSASAVCTPGAGVVCAADLQPVLDDGLTALIDAVVAFGGFFLPIIIVFALFWMIYRWFRRRVGGAKQV